MTVQEANILMDAISKTGKLSFPVSHIIGGLVCGAVYEAKRNPEAAFRLTLKRRILFKFSSSYRNLISFIRMVGVENIDIAQTIDENARRSKLHVQLANGREPDWEQVRERISKFSEEA